MMILGLFACLFGILLPFVSYSVFFQIKYDDDDDEAVVQNEIQSVLSAVASICEDEVGDRLY